jgi:hypothetical protein
MPFKSGRFTMKRLTLIILSVMLVLPFMVNDSFAAGGHKFKFQEKLRSKYLCSSKYYYCDVYDFGDFKAQAQLSLAEVGIDASQFTDKTTISMNIYDWGFSATLGEGGYLPSPEGVYPKKGAAYYAFSGYDWWLEVGVQFLVVQVNWNTKKMKIKVTALTEPYETDEENDPWALMVWPYLYDTGSYYEQMFTAVGLDVDGNDATDDDLKLIQFDVGCNIKTKTKEDRRSGFELNNVKIKGSGYGYEVDELTLTETFMANGYKIPEFLLRR